jgi:hypothetical protein
LIYQKIEYKKHQKVKFVIPTDLRIIDPQTKDLRIIDPQTKEILWRFGVIQLFASKSKSAWILENGAKENIRISLFCVLPVN